MKDDEISYVKSCGKSILGRGNDIIDLELRKSFVCLRKGKKVSKGESVVRMDRWLVVILCWILWVGYLEFIWKVMGEF